MFVFRVEGGGIWTGGDSCSLPLILLIVSPLVRQRGRNVRSGDDGEYIPRNKRNRERVRVGVAGRAREESVRPNEQERYEEKQQSTHPEREVQRSLEEPESDESGDEQQAVHRKSPDARPKGIEDEWCDRPRPAHYDSRDERGFDEAATPTVSEESVTLSDESVDDVGSNVGSCGSG